MERVFKIKTKSVPDLSNQYPSERRYSASMVQGLSTIFLYLCALSIVIGAVILHKMSAMENFNDDLSGTSTEEQESIRRLTEKLERDLASNSQTYLHYYINIPALVAGGCFIMAFGNLIAFMTGILAWKRWYIDQNIMFFFLASCFSALTSVVSLLISSLTASNTKSVKFEDFKSSELSPLTVPVVANTICLSTVSIILSFWAANDAYKGMRNSYPNDIEVTGGRIEVSTIKKGSQNNLATNIPVEVINNFAVGKMAKYLPKKEVNSDLPKQESNAEYQQRVNKFLNAQPEEECKEGQPNSADTTKPEKEA